MAGKDYSRDWYGFGPGTAGETAQERARRINAGMMANVGGGAKSLAEMDYRHGLQFGKSGERNIRGETYGGTGGYEGLGGYRKYLSRAEADKVYKAAEAKYLAENDALARSDLGLLDPAKMFSGSGVAEGRKLGNDPLYSLKPLEGEPPDAYIARVKKLAPEFASSLEQDAEAMEELFPGMGADMKAKLEAKAKQDAIDAQTKSVNDRIDQFSREMMSGINPNDPRVRELNAVIGSRAGSESLGRGLGRGGYSEMARGAATASALGQYDMQRKQMGMEALDRLRQENLARAGLGQQTAQFDAQMKQSWMDRQAQASRQAFEDAAQAKAAKEGGLWGLAGGLVGGYFGGAKGAEAGYSAGAKYGAGRTAGSTTYTSPYKYGGGGMGGGGY